MQSKNADAYVNISTFSMNEATEDLRVNSIHDSLRTWKLMSQVISHKFNISVCNISLQYATVDPTLLQQNDLLFT